MAVTGLAGIVSFSASSADSDPRIALGQRLFSETRLANPLGDMVVSCATCHAPADTSGFHGFADPLGRSWQPWRSEDPGRETLRNAPGIFDMADHGFIHADGQFLSLEEQSEATLTGRNFGWLPSETDAARTRVAGVLRAGYAAEMKDAYGVDVGPATDDECVRAASRAISDFVRSLTSARTSPYDRFLAANHFDDGPKPGEGPAAYGARLIAEIDRKLADKALTNVDGFGADALEGYRIFLRSGAEEKSGNCVVCHIPPTFTDRSFHNIGVTQEEYDALHGTGSFAKLDIPAAGMRPVERFQKRARLDRPGETDLGYWNYARFENSPLYQPQESEPSFRARTIATFKTPPLRNLPSTPPYLHNGLYPAIESVLQLKVEMAFLARMGDLRNADPELGTIRIMEDDFPALFAFLNALSDEGTRTATFHSGRDGAARVAPTSTYSLGTDSDPAATVGASGAAAPAAGSTPDETR